MTVSQSEGFPTQSAFSPFVFHRFYPQQISCAPKLHLRNEPLRKLKCENPKVKTDARALVDNYDDANDKTDISIT